MRYIDATQVLVEIAAKHGFTREQVLKKDNHRVLVLCRREVIYRLRTEGMSWHDIGAIIDRNHSTCILGYRCYVAAQRKKRDQAKDSVGPQAVSKGWRQDRCGSDYLAAW